MFLGSLHTDRYRYKRTEHRQRLGSSVKLGGQWQSSLIYWLWRGLWSGVARGGVCLAWCARGLACLSLNTSLNFILVTGVDDVNPAVWSFLPYVLSFTRVFSLSFCFRLLHSPLSQSLAFVTPFYSLVYIRWCSMLLVYMPCLCLTL